MNHRDLILFGTTMLFNGGGAAPGCTNLIDANLTVTAGNTVTYTGDTCIAVGVTVTVEDTGTLEII